MQSLISISIVILLIGLVHQPLAAKPRKSARVQTQPTMFSTPDAEADVLPTFVTAKGQPMTLQAHPRLPGFQHVKLLKGLTVEQKRAIANLESDTNIRIHALQEHMAVLNQRLDVAKAHPDEMVFVQYTYLARPAVLKKEIAELRKAIDLRRREAEKSLSALLTENQLNQIDRMRQGQLVQDVTPSVDAEHLQTFSGNPEPKSGTAAGAGSNLVPSAPAGAKLAEPMH